MKNKQWRRWGAKALLAALTALGQGVCQGEEKPMENLKMDLGGFENVFRSYWSGEGPRQNALCEPTAVERGRADFLKIGEEQSLYYVSFPESCASAKAPAQAAFFEKGERGAWRLLASFELPRASEARVKGEGLWLKETGPGALSSNETLALFADGEVKLFRTSARQEVFDARAWLPDFKKNCEVGAQAQGVLMGWIAGRLDEQGKPVWAKGDAALPKEMARARKSAGFAEKQEEGGKKAVVGRVSFVQTTWGQLPVDSVELERWQGSQSAELRVNFPVGRRQAIDALRKEGWMALDYGVSSFDSGSFELKKVSEGESQLVCRFGQ